MKGRDIRIPSMGDFTPPDINFRLIGLGVVAMVVLGLVASSVYKVTTQEVGVVKRFGAYNRTAEAGLKFKLPFPIETVTKVRVEEQKKEEFGYRTVDAAVRTRYSPRDFLDESLMLTGDLNVAVVDWETQYRIDDAFKYLFKVRNVRETFRDLNEAVMREVVGDRSVDEVITTGRQDLAIEAQRRLQELCDQYETGIRVIRVLLQDATAPDEVKPSFNEVNQAQQEKKKMENQANGEYNRIIPRARGEAEQTIQEAEGYAADRVNRAKGDASRFESLLAAYRRSPEVTRRRIYLETMQAVLPAIGQKIILDEDLKSVLPLLSLQKGGE